MTKSIFISNLIFYKYMIDENLPVDKQMIDEIEEDREPDMGDEKEDLQQEK